MSSEPRQAVERRNIKATLSVCPRCLVKVPANVFERTGQVFLEKVCPTHGVEEALLSSDATLYWHDERGKGACGPSGCTLGHSCTLIFEVTEKCNLTCPTCFTASSPHETWSMTLAGFEERLEQQIAAGRKDADIVQFSGGEPTIHPDLEQMIALAFRRGIRRVYVNTNGVRLAKDREFAARLGAIRAQNDLQLYLQLDGTRDETSSLLRGRRGLSEVKRRAIANALEQGIYVLPVMTVTRGVNTAEIGDVIRLAREHHPAMNTVMLQPAFYSGRYEHAREVGRVTVGEVARLVEEQTGGLFTRDDFGPMPCSHPNCFAFAVGLVREGRVIPISRYFPKHATWERPDVAERIARFADKMPQNLLESLEDDAMIDTLLDLLASPDEEIDWSSYKNFFLVGIKPFMDAHTYDQDRVDRCCVHVVDRAGHPVSLCEYNTLRRPRGLL
jgi:7,8-dihydro-6-hydroxymethylpterin dimethyltransferase